MNQYGLTPRQLRFCLLIVQGETQAKAYELAGYAKGTPKTVDANASRLARNDKCVAFIADQRALTASRAGVTVESITANLERISRKAEDAGSFGPAAIAQGMIAKLNGLMVDKSELTISHRPAPLPTKVLELSEQDWIRQFGQGLQEQRLQKLEQLARK
jgi:hypothetical protein